MAVGDAGAAGTGGMISHTGRTHDGRPLALNHAPAPGLAPWFCWFSAASADLPHGARIADAMLNDNACIRILFGGRWSAETADGPMVFEPGESGLALHFGPHSRAMRIAIEGSFKVITAQLAPGASAVMGGPKASALMDRIVDHDRLVGHGSFASRFDPLAGPATWLAVLERELARFVGSRRTPPVDPLTLAFERCALADPTIEIAAFADSHGVTTRTVERVIGRSYGLTPKQVLRRARALDMAAVLLGVAMAEEEAELRLRYFDQSHLTREIRAFFGTTPRALRAGAHPLLRLNLEVRQARRVQALALLPPDALEPWRDPAAEPPR